MVSFTLLIASKCMNSSVQKVGLKMNECILQNFFVEGSQKNFELNCANDPWKSDSARKIMLKIKGI